MEPLMEKNFFSTVLVGTHQDSTIEIPGKKVIQITFDDKEDTFIISSADQDFKYSVPRVNLVGDFRYHGEVVSQILKNLDCNDDTHVISIDDTANDKIYEAMYANIDLFPFPELEHI